jgi:thiamine biosynthesis lipoprotein
MASDVTIHGWGPGACDPVLDDALAVFSDMDRTCTRFDPQSALMRVNRSPDRWHRVPPVLFDALREAYRAYQHTKGRFDPRVLRDLVDLGYDRSLPFRRGGVTTGGNEWGSRKPPDPWQPRFRGGTDVHLGAQPVDLGGIGKGLAIRWAATRLPRRMEDYLIDAGGDCLCRGNGPDGHGWRIGVEDPRGGEHPLAVLELHDRACATSSVRLRRWQCRGKTVHHLLDPRTGRPGGAGLVAVTVIGDDPAESEVLSKTLFLCGRSRIADEAARLGAAAYWVRTDGRTGETPAFSKYVIWRAA